MPFKDFNFDLKQVRGFLEVVSEKSFTNASRNLKMSQASISHQVGQLEKMLGLKLINRNSQDFSLTDEGKVFIKFCEKLMKDINNLKSEMQAGTFGGVINIISSSIPGTYIIPGMINAHRKISQGSYYKLEIGNSREAIEKIKQGEVDLAITGREIKHPSLSYSEIFNDEILLVTIPGEKTKIPADDLKTIPMIIRETGSGTKNVVENALLELGIQPSELNIVMECTTSEGLREAVISGNGYAFISSLAVDRDVKLGKIKVCDTGSLKIKRPFFLVTSKVRPLNDNAANFIEFIRAGVLKQKK
ncbi:MAG TPA: LysR family transcriptional regulator [Spirochaetota bacterium]|nr:LysR family transcriptional regulator [Spirochaetota bacterium]